MVFVSTDFVYDPRQRRLPQREEDGQYLTDGYGGQKRGCELEFIAAGTALPWTIVRPCHICHLLSRKRDSLRLALSTPVTQEPTR